MKEFSFMSEADAAEKMTSITIQEVSQLVWSLSPTNSSNCLQFEANGPETATFFAI